MFWYKIVEWFRDRSNRQKLILDFNTTAKESFILDFYRFDLTD